MEPTVARVVLEHRHEGALLRLTLSAETLRQLVERRDLDLRLGEEGVFFMEGPTGVELRYGDEPIELVRLEVHVNPE